MAIFPRKTGRWSGVLPGRGAVFSSGIVWRNALVLVISLGTVPLATLVSQGTRGSAARRPAGVIATRSQGERAALLDRILRAEDRRAAHPEDLRTLLGAARAGDTQVAARAIRALGRLERPTLVPELLPPLSHPVPGIRREAAQALAQALQRFRRDTIALRPEGQWLVGLRALRGRVERETDPEVRGMLALSLGRLPYRTDEERLEAERAIRLVLARGSTHPLGRSLAVRGAERIRRNRPRGAVVDESLTVLLRAVARAPDSSEAGRVARRRALGALLLSGDGAAGDTILGAAAAADDPELRRIAVSAAGAVRSEGLRRELVRTSLGDTAPIVRREIVRSLSQGGAAASCLLREAIADHDEGTRLLALDLLGGGSCPDTAGTVVRLLAVWDADGPARREAWRGRAHALVALARLDAGRAEPLLSQASPSPVWQMRMYAARAAAALRDTVRLGRLAGDTHPNVQEAALVALRSTGPRAAEAAAVAALAGRDNQLLLTAAEALEGAPPGEETARALADALDRVSAEGKETSRDTRVGLIHRLRFLGSRADVARLRPRLTDFDPVVADSAAAVLSSWTGEAVRASPRPHPTVPVSRRESEALRGSRLRMVMATGDTIDAELLVDEAPATVLRMARLIRAGYFDGLTFHRVVPNFVIQGGSPGANEYAGDGPYMRDELGSASHERGTFGISTRGRDTGDAQLFVNLVDNPRLDYDYTVWARVVRGITALDRIGEGDVIRRIEIHAR